MSIRPCIPHVICKSSELIEPIRRSLQVTWNKTSNSKTGEKEPFPRIIHVDEWKGENDELKGNYFNLKEYFHELKTRELGTTIVYSHEMASTQSLLKENCTGIYEGITCVADLQSEGKGRGSNVWTSPPGCLLFSCKAKFTNGSTLPFVQYLVSIAIIRAIKNVNGLNDAPVNIKWPNDIYANGKEKIGGVLCQSSYMGGNFDVTIGVGLNITNKEPTTCLDNLKLSPASKSRPNTVVKGVSSDLSMVNDKVTREIVLAKFFNELEPMIEQFIVEGFEPFRSEYVSHWLHTNQKVFVEYSSTTTPLWIKGLSESGYLLAADESGNVTELYPDGNSFDFFKGLIRKKK